MYFTFIKVQFSRPAYVTNISQLFIISTVLDLLLTYVTEPIYHLKIALGLNKKVLFIHRFDSHSTT